MVRFPRLAEAYAEYVSAPPHELAVKPAGVDHAIAASAPMIGLTAWRALFTQGGLRTGQRVLVHGASGGVGHVAVQLARAAGAEVIGTASTLITTSWPASVPASSSTMPKGRSNVPSATSTWPSIIAAATTSFGSWA
jgi:hypothetical protein